TGNVYDIEVSGNCAFLASREYGLNIVDVSDTTNIHSVGLFDTPDAATRIQLVGNNIFIADRATGIIILDVSDTTNPIEMDSYELSSICVDLAVEGKLIYAADYLNGLDILDASDVTNIQPVSSLDLGYYVLAVDVAGNYACLGGKDGWFSLVDISDTTDPQLVSELQIPGLEQVLDIEIYNDYAFVANNSGGLHVIDLRDTASLAIVDSYETVTSARNVFLHDKYLYMGAYNNGVQIFDIVPFQDPLDLPEYWFIFKVTDNQKNDIMPVIHGDQIVFRGYYNGTGDAETLLYDLRTGNTINVSDNGHWLDYEPFVNNGQVVWRSLTETNSDTGRIHFWDGETTTIIAEYDKGPFDGYSGFPPSWHSLMATLSNGQIVWAQWDGNDYEIMLWNGDTITQLTDNESDDYEPFIENGQVTWTGGIEPNTEIFFWDGDTIINVSNCIQGDDDPMLSNGRVVWSQTVPNGSEIMMWDGDQIHQITSNNVNDYEAWASNGWITWHSWVVDDSHWAVFYWDGQEEKRLTDNTLDEGGPSLYDNKLVFGRIEAEGDDEIMLAMREKFGITEVAKGENLSITWIELECPGVEYVVQFSEDLTSWDDIDTGSYQAYDEDPHRGFVKWTDYDEGRNSLRCGFYRVMVLDDR
ncbi:hypothetical protein KKB99_06385, partial [bacterium]|nr:hypothetical protein [bacterium]MBU1025616.1 hypothetical protein [bacterium]